MPAQPHEPSTARASIVVPTLVRQRAMAYGSAGRRWLDDLPGLVASLARQWDLVIGDPYHGGTASYVAAAADGSGRACVLKVAMTVDERERAAFRNSVVAHDLARGRGCAQLYAHDEATSAMLLEPLGRNLDDLGMPLPELLESIAGTLRTFWRPVPVACGLPSAVDKAQWLADFITTSWDELGRPCRREVVDRAVAFCRERADAFDPAHAVLVHGDAHGWNTLDAGGGTFKFVDPEGLASEPAHDLAVPLREYNLPLLEGDTPRLARERAEMLAASCDVDPEAVWQWGFIERVATGLSTLRDLEDDGGALFLDVATRCL